MNPGSIARTVSPVAWQAWSVGEAATARTLVLLRHAKAQGSAASDHERELSPRGHSQATAVGHWLAGAGHRFGAVVVSTATRTRQTWSQVEAAGVPADEFWFDTRLYDGDAHLVLDVLAEIPDQVGSVLVIGHAPTIPDLAGLLADPDASKGEALDALRSSFPAGCLALLTIDTSWAALTPGRAALAEVATPGG